MNPVPVPQILREKVFIEPGLTNEELASRYGVPRDTAYRVRLKGFFVRLFLEISSPFYIYQYSINSFLKKDVYC